MEDAQEIRAKKSCSPANATTKASGTYIYIAYAQGSSSMVSQNTTRFEGLLAHIEESFFSLPGPHHVTTKILLLLLLKGWKTE